jgi:hypothetical protein
MATFTFSKYCPRPVLHGVEKVLSLSYASIDFDATLYAPSINLSGIISSVLS